MSKADQNKNKLFKVVDAQHRFIEDVPVAEFEKWTISNEWILNSRVGNTVTVYPGSYQSIVQEFEERRLPVTRRLESGVKLADHLRSRLDRVERVIVYPGKEMLRHLFNFHGFVTAMDRLLDENNDLEAFLPAGEYRGKWLFGVQRKS